MKALLVAAGLALAMAGTAAAQPAPPEVAGDWHGALSVGGQTLPVVFHLGEEVTGDSPSEQRFGILGKLESSGGKYRLSFISGSVFEGELKDGKLVGALQTQAAKLPLVLERKAAEKK